MNTTKLVETHAAQMKRKRYTSLKLLKKICIRQPIKIIPETSKPEKWKQIRKNLINRQNRESSPYITQDLVLQRLIQGKLMKRGQYNTGMKILNKTIKALGHWLPIKRALTKLTPLLISKPFKKSGKIHQLPTGIQASKRISIAISWLLESARRRSRGRTGGLVKGLVEEIKDVNKSQGLAWKKKIDNYQLAFSNRIWLKFTKMQKKGKK